MEKTFYSMNMYIKGPIRTFFDLSSRVLFEPVRFFRYDLSYFSTSEALAFGLTCAWLATFFSFFWSGLYGMVFSNLLGDFIDIVLPLEEASHLFSDASENYLYNASSLLLHPFVVLLQICCSAYLIFRVAKFLVPVSAYSLERPTYQGMLKIFGVALASQWLQVVPVLGGLLAYLAMILLTMTGIRERYHVSTARAVAIVLAPYLLVAMLLLLFLFLLFQLPIVEMLSEVADI